MIAHEEMLDNVALYALGALPHDEAITVLEHMRTCADCRREYEALRPAVTAAAAAEAESGPAPSPLLRARIMREVRRTAATPLPARRSQMWVAAAAAVVLVGAGIFTGAALMNGRMQGAAGVIATQSQMMGDLAAGKRYNFGDGAVVVRATRLYVTMPNMPMPPKGMVYQAWTLPKGSKKMAPSITFMPSNDETVVRLPQSADGVAAVAVSVEPAGGSLQPTSKPIAVAVL